jgi:hypothetical protein
MVICFFAIIKESNMSHYAESNPVEMIVNPKSLEKQIKILDDRILELQSELSDLEKKKEACHILLGVPVTAVGASPEPVTQGKKPVSRKKRDLEKEVSSDDLSPLSLDGSSLENAEDSQPAH